MIVASGLSDPETPVSLGGERWLVPEMGTGFVSRLDTGSGEVERLAHTGRPNGVAWHDDGSIWIAESYGLGDGDGPGLKRLLPSGEVEAVIDHHGAIPLRWPNDLVFGADGALYFTDSGTSAQRIVGEQQPLDPATCDGRVYRYEPGGGELTLLDEGLIFANGIAFGPQGELYVTESERGLVHRYELGSDGRPGRRATVADVIDRAAAPAGFCGPDGLAVAPDGRLFVCVFGQGHVAVVEQDGSISSRIPVGGGQRPTNCAFGPDGRLYVTEIERGVLLALEVS